MEDGLPGNSVFTIIQTRDGYLWIGTQGGLVRFDGVNFEIFSNSNTPQLKDNVIRSLYQGKDGCLWIGSHSGGLTRYLGGEFSAFPVETHPGLLKIYAIGEDREGNLWIGSMSNGLTCFNKNGFTTYTMENGLPGNQVRSFYKDAGGYLWAVTGGGIIRVNKPGNFQIMASQNQLPYYKTTCLYDVEQEELWIGTGDRGLLRMKDNTIFPVDHRREILHPTINCIHQDKSANLWVGTDGGGLARIGKGVIDTFKEGDPLAGQSVYALAEDREGNMWAGTLDNGLYQLSDSKFTTFTEREGLTQNFVQAIYELRSGDILIGTKQGLNLLDVKKGTISTLLTAASGLLDASVICLWEEADEEIWIGAWGGLHRYDISSRRLTGYTQKDGLSNNHITSIGKDRNGMMWVGTENGLNRFDSRTGGVSPGLITHFTRKDGLPGNNIKFVFEDSRGNLWIGAGNGVCTLKNDVVTSYNLETEGKKPIFYCAFEDSRGTMWFGGDLGLIRGRESGSGWSMFIYNTQGGLIENNIYAILEDDSGYLWTAGPNGISRLDKKQLEQVARGTLDRIKPLWFNEKDGLESRWCTGAAVKTRDRRLWFGASVGMTTIDPGDIHMNTIPPPMAIEKIAVDGKSLNIKRLNRKGAGLLELPPGKTRFEFYYTAISFINPGKMRFKTKLEGYDKDWLDNGSLRSITYTGLSPGRYTFKIKAGNADGVWNEKVASVSFYLRPFFYQTVWFYILFIFLFMMLALLLHVYRVNRLRLRRKELKEQVALRTRQLEERNSDLEKERQKVQGAKEMIEAKNRQLEVQSEKLSELDKAKSRLFANISHEFRTPLTLIKGPLEEILVEKPGEKLKARANLMLRNANRLLNLVEQLLELAKFDSGGIRLQVAQQDIIAFLKSIVMCFQSLAQQKSIQLEFREPGGTIPLYFDPEKLERIVYNLLTNAFNYTSSGGSIRVSLWHVSGAANFSGYVEISVRDTGAGIPSEQLPHIFDRFSQGENPHEYKRKGTGIGLALTRELVELHHGSIEVRSNYKPGPMRGTEFIVKLPLGSDHFQPGEIVESAAYEPGLAIEAPEHPEISGAVKQSPAASETPVILVVDDNADVREYIKGALKTRFAIIEAADGEEGLEKAGEYMPELVISDVMMPGLDGFELCCRLKKDIKTSHIPVILLTAKASEDSVMRGMDCLADDYITKPFNSKILLSRVKNLIRQRRQLQRKLQGDMLLTPGKMSISSVDRKFMDDIRSVMEDNLSDLEFRVEHLAQKLYMGKSTLYRKVEALTGQSPQMYIRSYRLNRAAQLLKANFGNVTEVAFAVGFSSAPYFTKCFKEKFKTVPSEYMPMDDK